MKVKASKGFTLAELLITLAILGVVAIFTIPKLLATQQNQQKNAIMKETASMISAAYQKAKNDGLVTASMRLQDLTPYFNYVSVDTSSNIDDMVGFGSLTCTAAAPCYKLHSGALLMDRGGFAGLTNMDAMVMHLDLEASYSGSATGAEKSVMLILFYTGRISSRGVLESNFRSNMGTWGPDPNADPPWVQW